MNIFKELLIDIRDEFKYYRSLSTKEVLIDIRDQFKNLPKTIIEDYKESQVKKNIAKHEEETARTLKAKQARYAYYTELITQCNCNVILIRAKINSYHANITSLGTRGHKEIKERLTKEIAWLKNKLNEEEFLSNHYTTLSNE